MEQHAARSADDVPRADEINLLDYLAVVWRFRWLVAGLVLVTLVVTFVVTQRLPRMYESRATLLAPKEGRGVAGLLGFAGAEGVGAVLQQGLGIPSITPNRDMFLSVLKSRRMAEMAIQRFGLQERYRALYLEDAVLILQGLLDINFTQEGVVWVTALDTDPQVAAAIANFYMQELDRLVAEYSVDAAGRQRTFLTQQLARARVDLETAEDHARRFQEKNRAVALQEQTRGAIEAAARLKGEIMAAEVQLQVMRQFATDANPEVMSLRQRIEEMRRQLTRMQFGDGTTPATRRGRGQEDRDFAVPLPKVPEVGLEMVRLMREVKVQETLVQLLTEQLEQTKLVEAKDMPQVQLLDRAVPAERPSRPRLRLNLLVAGSASLLTGLFLAFVAENVRVARRRRRGRKG